MHFFSEKQHSNDRSLLQIFNLNKLRAAKFQSYHNKFSRLVDFSGKYREFLIPAQRENLSFSANGTQQLQYWPTSASHLRRSIALFGRLPSNGMVER
jgi:hypothetical protein